jgi:hypothetical protein
VTGTRLAGPRGPHPCYSSVVDLGLHGQEQDNMWTDDTGNGVKGYRLDLYEGVGKAVCAGYDNVMAVGACTPALPTCPGSAVQ